MSSPSTCVCRVMRSSGSSRMSDWYSVRRAGSFGNPSALVVFACGSQSMTSVRCSATAREAPRLTAVVVFPTPPFWLAMAIMRAKLSPRCRANVAETNLAVQDVSRGTSSCWTNFSSRLFHVKRDPSQECYLGAPTRINLRVEPGIWRGLRQMNDGSAEILAPSSSPSQRIILPVLFILP
jgi:hypothetical protein